MFMLVLCTLASSQSRQEIGIRVRRREHGARERERYTGSVVRESEDSVTESGLPVPHVHPAYRLQGGGGDFERFALV